MNEDSNATGDTPPDPTPDPAEPAVPPDPLSRFAADYLDVQRAGQRLSLTVLLARHPQVHDLLTEAILSAQLEQDLGGTSPPTAMDAVATGPSGVVGGRQAADPPTIHHLGADPEQAPADQRIGPYVVQRELGRGGQAIVYLAQDTRLPRRVAIKLLQSRDLFASREAFQRFRNEAETTSRIEHAGIGQVYETGEHQGQPYIVMRYVEGGSLAERIASARSERGGQGGRFQLHLRAADDATVVPGERPSPSSRGDLATTLLFIERVARSLHVVHEAGVIHRDLKPGNIMVQTDGSPVVLDFGLARDESSAIANLTQTGDQFGTPAYMAPEQVRPAGDRPDRRVDVYALGVTLYEALSGERPFDAPTAEGLYRQILAAHPTPLRKHCPHLPAELLVVVATAMDQNRERRYQTALELAEDLAHVRLREPIRAEPAGIGLRLRRWVQRNPIVATFVSLLTLALVSTGWMFLRSETNFAAFRKLADARAIDYIEREAELEIWPAWPDKVRDIERWLRNAESVGKRRDVLLDALAELRERGRRTDAGDYQFDDSNEQTVYNALARAEARLDAFDALVAKARRNLDWARSIEARSLRDPAQAWRAAQDRVRADPRFVGIELSPQMGLIPIGPDPVTKLEEFGHVRSGRVPQRDASGRLERAMDTSMVFVLLPGGRTTVGVRNEGGPDVPVDPAAQQTRLVSVRLDPFLIGKDEVTQHQWRALGGTPRSKYREGGEYFGERVTARHPVESVSHSEATRILNRNRLELPTEVQWEYAARAGTLSPWGVPKQSLREVANLFDQTAKDAGHRASSDKFERWRDGYAIHAPVGVLLPNGFGLHDTLGNVWEWCRDRYTRFGRANLPVPRDGDGLLEPAGQTFQRAGRGGSFGFASGAAKIAARGFVNDEFRDAYWGIRAVRRLLPARQ